MTDREHGPFDPEQVENQVDRLSASGRETYGTSRPDQRLLHDLRLILVAEDAEAQSQKDEHFLQQAWKRIEAANYTYNTVQGTHSSVLHRRLTVMSTLSSTPERATTRISTFKRRLTALVAAIVALTLIGVLAMFTLASHRQQPQSRQASQSPTSYVYHEASWMGIYSLQWSADGTRIISAGQSVNGWDAFSGAHATRYIGTDTKAPGSFKSTSHELPFDIQLSPDNKMLAVWDIGQIELYDVATGKHLSTLTYPFSQTAGDKYDLPHFGPYIGWSLDSKSVRTLVQIPAANQTVVNKIVTYDAATGTHQEQILSLDGQLDRAAWSPNGKYLAVGRTFDGTVSVIAIASGQIVSSLQGGAPIETIPLNWSPDSLKVVADFGNNNGLYVMDAATGHDIVVYQGGTLPTWSPNGKYLAVVSGSTVKILNASTGKLLHTYTDASRGIGALAWSPNSTALAAGGSSSDGNSQVNVWKVTL